MSTFGIGGALALMHSRTENQGNEFAMTVLPAPASLDATAAGRDVTLDWPGAEHADFYDVAVGTADEFGGCQSASYGSIATPSASMYLDSGRGVPAGVTYCYRVSSRVGEQWSSITGNPVQPVKVGNVPESVAWVQGSCGGGAAGRINCGDQLRIQFTQPLDPTTIPWATSVCDGGLDPITLYLGSAAAGECDAGTEDPWLGELVGSTAGTQGRWDATFELAGDGSTLVITIGSQTFGNAQPRDDDGPWTLYPTSNPETEIGQAPLCEGLDLSTCTQTTGTNP